MSLRRGDHPALKMAVVAFLAAAGVAVYLPLTRIFSGYLRFLDLSVYLLAVHAGAIPFFFVMRPKRGEALLYGGAVVTLTAMSLSARSAPWKESLLPALLLAAGSVALFELLLLAWMAEPRRRFRSRQALAAILVMHLSVLVSRITLAVLSDALPLTFDRQLYAIDAGFGTQVSFLAGRWFTTLPALAAVCRLVYLALPFGVLFLFATLRCETRARWVLLAHFALIGIFGRYCYAAVPAMGPAYQFPDRYPWNPPKVAELSIQRVRLQDGARNAMPSLHTAWALMLVWWTRRQARWLRVSADAFRGCTLLATLGLGEHYLVDLIAGVPFAVATFALVPALAGKGGVRFGQLAGGGGLLVLWLAMIRWGSPFLIAQPAVLWTVGLGTVVGCVVLNKQNGPESW